MNDLNSLMIVNDTLRAHGNDSMLASAEADMSDGLSREEIVASLRAQRADAE